MKKENKKASSLVAWSFGMSVLLIMAMIILIAFYDLHTGNFSTFIKKISGKSNLQDMTTYCNDLAERNARYEYCCAKKPVNYEQEDKTIREQLTCQELSTKRLIKIKQLNCEKIC